MAILQAAIISFLTRSIIPHYQVIGCRLVLLKLKSPKTFKARCRQRCILPSWHSVCIKGCSRNTNPQGLKIAWALSHMAYSMSAMKGFWDTNSMSCGGYMLQTILNSTAEGLNVDAVGISGSSMQIVGSRFINNVGGSAGGPYHHHSCSNPTLECIMNTVSILSTGWCFKWSYSLVFPKPASLQEQHLKDIGSSPQKIWVFHQVYTEIDGVCSYVSQVVWQSVGSLQCSWTPQSLLTTGPWLAQP